MTFTDGMSLAQAVEKFAPEVAKENRLKYPTNGYPTLSLSPEEIEKKREKYEKSSLTELYQPVK
ncbi:MAG: hypothetical protein ABJO09_05785 [Hyphomicrobiales bacterium]|uniref:hypothetical protein n=1 Tax=Alphaproteobacteria TaxID=28211 RepID=UPI00329A6B6B